MKFDLNNPRTLAITGVMGGLIFALTRFAQIPTPDGGYVHPGDVALYFTSFAFGPWAGMVAGGIGTALADLTSPYASFAPLTLVVHGIQGFVAGWIATRTPSIPKLLLAVAVGGVILVGGYFVGQGLIPIYGGWELAATGIPGNIGQALFGALGAAVYFGVERAYPRLRQST